MHGLCSGELLGRARVAILGVALFAGLVWLGSAYAHIWPTRTDAALPSLSHGVVAGVFVAGAVGAAVVACRRTTVSGAAWVVATGALVAIQSLLVTLLALQSTPPRSSTALAALLGVAVTGLALILVPLLRRQGFAHVEDVGLAVGLGLGLTAAGNLLLQIPLTSTTPVFLQVVIGVLVLTHVAATALVLRQRALAPSVRCLVIVTLLTVGAGLVGNAAVGLGTAWDAALGVTRAAIGATWLTLALVHFRHVLEEDRRRLETVQHVFAATTRGQCELRHELRSTVAGLVTGSALLDNTDVPPETRQRLLASVRQELERMERMLSGHNEPVTDIELDQALDLILELQRLKGRQIELRGHGDLVRARYDSLAEVVNILMDNAVTHGGTDSSLVEVVRRDEETVDITVTDHGRGIPQDERPQIFDWGRRGSDSPGEGIGLHVAQRLMTQDGGSLRLAEGQGVGSTFVISLPAARRSSENDPTRQDGRDWRRSG